ncbi:MDR family MFS transporter [uncultured Serinicoccus sp.]|uniref:MDR family MFS transporter n=1 Tax=uncultured Serinicoccus sp. TaxID=735514 RepID=UPI002610BE24|nr:MDR family MFS transporter [uncultured Serinicoccus sp.]
MTASTSTGPSPVDTQDATPSTTDTPSTTATAVDPTASSAPAFRLSREHKIVFAGLMMGMFVASISQTIVGPALPQIVADLGGMSHYSWVATAAMLVSAVVVPVVGKLSDLYGRKTFYLAGLVIFMVGSIVSGLAGSFWMLVAGRAIQGAGMGTLMPLSQTIIGDIIPARQRGKYQGLMGAVFGVTSVAGPLAGGLITDHLGWRWLFFTTLPIGLLTLWFVLRHMHLPHQRREAKIDVAGIVTLSVAMVSILLATSWGGTTYPWASAEVLGLYALGLVTAAAFVVVELRASEPLLPLRLFRNSVFSWANVAGLGLAMVMFGSIIYIPVFAQGVLGVDATQSGLILMPMMLGLIVMGILTGLLVTKTGHYKPFMLTGVAIMASGVWLLTMLSKTSSPWELFGSMAVVGVGLGMAMQQYTLVVQNVVARRDLGVATATTQFSRNIGSTVGIAVYGSIMTGGLGAAVASHLPAQMREQAAAQAGSLDVGAVLDPGALGGVPPVVQEALRAGLADQLHGAFLIGLPILALVFLATAMIKHVPLKDTLEDAPADQG